MAEQPLNFEKIKVKLSEKPSEELITILATRQEDYNIEVKPILKSILIDRGYSKEDVEGFDNEFLIGKNKSKQSKDKTSIFKIRYIFYAILLFGLGYLFVLFTTNSPQEEVTQLKDSVWSKSYKDKIYKTIYKTTDTLFRTDDQMQIFTNCGVEKLEHLLPEGLESIPADSLKKIYYKTGIECASEMRSLQLTKWNPDLEETLKKSLISSPQLKELKPNLREKFCDCYIRKLKENYPRGIDEQIPEEIQNKIGKECADELLKN